MTLIYARVIEVNPRHLTEIEDVLLFQKNGETILKVLPAPKFLLAHEPNAEIHLAARIQAFFRTISHAD